MIPPVKSVFNTIARQARLFSELILIYSYINSNDDCISLQQDLAALEQWSLKWQMLFNPAKCIFLRITNKKDPLIHNYYIATSPIKEATSMKYLEVQINNKLTWNDHIQYITHKAAQVNGFLHRNLRQCPSNIKSMCYKSMVRPILEYASTVWDPHTNVNITKLESVQRLATRFEFCLGDYSRYSSVTSMLQLLDLSSLQLRRKLAKLTTMYKIINSNLHIPSNSLIPNHRNSRDGYFTQL